MNTRKEGTRHELAAEQFLISLGMKTAVRNYRTRKGEIDLIMTQRGTLVFVEVKFRKSSAAGFSLDAVDLRKRRQITNVARQFIMMHPEYAERNIRFDCVGIDGDRISYISNAFDINGKTF